MPTNPPPQLRPGEQCCSVILPGRLGAGIRVGALAGNGGGHAGPDVTADALGRGEEGAIVPLGAKQDYIHLGQEEED
jgi:hypothetical protein